MSASLMPRVLRFGVFEVDLRTQELRKQGNLIRLHGQPFQILSTLLERPGEIVMREELRQKLWAADTYVDFDNSVNAAINRLREALGDSAENPRFVETLPRRGYRFIAPVISDAHRAAQESRLPEPMPAAQQAGAKFPA
jgi:DNA-binding winged helix-turn-helix (wHTH) protein